MTSANLLTILRLLLTPVFILLILYGELRLALLVFLLAGFTDLLDGLIARRFNQRSELGSFLDPIADKLLLVSSFLVLTVGADLLVRIPLWLTVAVISRDILLVTAVIVINLSLGKHLFLPSIYGKWTTTLQLLTVLTVLASDAMAYRPPFINGLFLATLALTVFSGLHYLLRGLRVIEHRGGGVRRG